MSFLDGIQILSLIIVVILISPLLGQYMASIFQRNPTILSPWLNKIENFIYRVCKIDPKNEMNWKEYLITLLLFNFWGFVFIFIIQITQAYLPLNPQNLPNVPVLLALNTAISFVTNTDWQAYAGETTLSYFTQMTALTTQNFLSAATGFCVFLPLIRSFINRVTTSLGNFWVDLVRSILYILIPLSFALAIILVSQGVVQTLKPYQEITTLENQKQIIPLGPVASQVAIKQLGTNGGGYFGTNSAHPLENPNTISNFFEQLAILLIPASLVFTFGYMINDRAQSNLLFYIMVTFWVLSIGAAAIVQTAPNPAINLTQNLEGIETRIDTSNSFFWTMSTTNVASGSANAALSSLAPLTGGLALFNMMLGEVIFGGIGTGISTMIAFVLLAVFIAGLMVGRTPEYLGKKIEKNEILLVIITLLGPGLLTLTGTALSCVIPEGVASVSTKGPHGFTEILYAFTSCVANNGSSFNGLDANTLYYNIFLSVVILLGRLLTIVPLFVIAGHVSNKRYSPPSQGTLATDTVLFGILLSGCILILGTLSYLPVLMLGPIFEHFMMLRGVVF